MAGGRTHPPGPVWQALAAERSAVGDLARDVGRDEPGRARHADTSSNRRAAPHDDSRASLRDLLPVRITGCPVAEDERAVDDERSVMSKLVAVGHKEVRL